jgi:hypothetical protein
MVRLWHTLEKKEGIILEKGSERNKLTTTTLCRASPCLLFRPSSNFICQSGGTTSKSFAWLQRGGLALMMKNCDQKWMHVWYVFLLHEIKAWHEQVVPLILYRWDISYNCYIYIDILGENTTSAYNRGAVIGTFTFFFYFQYTSYAILFSTR